MKRLLFIALLFIPMLSFGQARDPIPLRDSISYERDTIIKFAISDDYRGHIYFYVDSLAGTLDGVAQLMVADDLDNNTYTAIAPDDKFFLEYSALQESTLDGNKAVSFQFDEDTGYDWIGLKFTLNNITKWHIKYKLKLFRVK